MATTNLLQAVGLHTFNNNLDLPAGALLQADNVNIDRAGVIEPMRGFKQWQTVGSDVSMYASQLLSYKDRILAHYPYTTGDSLNPISGKLAYDNTSGSFINFTEDVREVETGLRIKSIELNGNLYFTTSKGIKKISAKSSSDLNTAKIVNAGGTRALDIELNTSTIGSGFLPSNSQVGYRVVWGVKDANSNLILGFPSPLNIVSNLGSEDVTVKVKFYVPEEIDTETSYFYQIYRTQIYSIDVVPSDELKLVYEGFNDKTTNWFSDYYEVTDEYSETLRQANTNLYTNQYSGEGIAYGNIKPPISKDITTYKNHVFYGNIKTNQQLTNTLLGVSNFTHVDVSSITGTTIKTVTTSNNHGLGNGDKIALRGTNLFDGIYTVSGVTLNTFTISFSVDPDSSNAVIQGGAVVYKTNLSITKDAVTNYYWPVGREQISKLKFNTNFTKQVTKFEFTSATNTDYSDERVIIRSVSDKKVYGIWFATTETAIEPLFTATVTDKVRIPLYASTLTSKDAIVQQTIDQFLLQVPDDFTLLKVISGSQYYIEFTTSIIGSASAASVEAGSNITKTSETIGIGPSVYANQQLTIYSAENKVKYLVWFDTTGKDTSPIDTSSAIIRIDLSSTDLITKEQIAEAFTNQLNNQVFDFLADVTTDTTTITTASSGSATNASLSNTPDSDLTLTNVQKGIGLVDAIGETTDNKYVLLSTSISSSVANEETTKSFLNVLNKNTNEEVYGYYVSSSSGLPGEFTLEARTSDDVVFTLSSNDNSVKTGSFNENLPQSSSSETLPNRLFFSKQSEPDSVPLVNYFDVGPRDKAIKRIIGLRDSLFIFKEEGIYRLFGNISTNFQVVLFDSSSNIVAPDSAVVLNNQIYLLTSQGVARVSETGVSIISIPIENIFTQVTSIPFYQWISFGISYEADRSYLLFVPFADGDTTATRAFRFNTFTESWTSWVKNYNCGTVHPTENKLYFGAVEDNYIEVERKTLTRQDYSNRVHTGKLIVGKLNSTKLILSNNQNLNIGDSLVQVQRVTISDTNKLINKIINDSYLNPNSTLTISEVSQFSNLSIKLSQIVSLLNQVDTSLVELSSLTTTNGSTTITSAAHGLTNGSKVLITLSSDTALSNNEFYEVVFIDVDNFGLKVIGGSNITFNGGLTDLIKSPYYSSQSNTFTTLQNEFNSVVDKLNTSNGAFFTNYQQSVGTTEFEAHVLNFSNLNTQVTVNKSTAFIIGECENHEGINSTVVYSYQHFGDPSVWKHVREAKIMFENDNFEGAYLGFNTDIANDFEEIQFAMEGDGSWGSGVWSEFSWGGQGSQAPFRTLIPRQKQRCRMIKARFRHSNARNKFAIYGLSYVYEGGTERTNK